MADSISLNLSKLFAAAAGANGLAEDDLGAEAAAAAFDAFEHRRSTGEVGFADLGEREDLAAGCREAAALVRAEASDFLHLGIGGSALGPRAILRALSHPQRNLLPPARRDGPRIFFVENVDPESLAAIRDVIDPSKTWINVVSKSGGTVETIGQWLVVRRWIEEAVGPEKARERTILTTDPEKGLLRRMAREEGMRTLEVPSNVGGRFSALTPVGLLSSAVAGIDPSEILEGARSMAARCTSGRIGDNPALHLAASLHALDVRKGRRTHVLMAYADALADTADWYCQLWAESLGKRYESEGEQVFTGPTPVKAVGAIDQHSQLQLYLEGPQDKVIVFLGVRRFREELEVPSGDGLPPEIAYLGGHGIGEILDVERRATEEALLRNGRPSATILLEELTPQAIGALYQLWELTTAYAGELYGVNAYDQPAVELGKRIAQRVLSRSGGQGT